MITKYIFGGKLGKMAVNVDVQDSWMNSQNLSFYVFKIRARKLTITFSDSIRHYSELTPSPILLGLSTRLNRSFEEFLKVRLCVIDQNNTWRKITFFSLTVKVCKKAKIKLEHSIHFFTLWVITLMVVQNPADIVLSDSKNPPHRSLQNMTSCKHKHYTRRGNSGVDTMKLSSVEVARCRRDNWKTWETVWMHKAHITKSFQTQPHLVVATLLCLSIVTCSRARKERRPSAARAKRVNVPECFSFNTQRKDDNS